MWEVIPRKVDYNSIEPEASSGVVEARLGTKIPIANYFNFLNKKRTWIEIFVAEIIRITN
ncbi:hypothetical protein VHA01S_085_00150 [Vibrio halioticoli NBRC 102217]|uniref:Uncharacterized protein n=1 Tax=Vibrio halioticoli NBRC 102217 TaxID=1219072 RepID=V5FHY9_9VIBR|nr:hypothetical protein VHA01S_085_00150 [Vibrio halioticoli NBRC 102217]